MHTVQNMINGIRPASDLARRLAAALPAASSSIGAIGNTARRWLPRRQRPSPPRGGSEHLAELERRQRSRPVPALLLVLAGAGLMYLLDPRHGAERRAAAWRWVSELWQHLGELAVSLRRSAGDLSEGVGHHDGETGRYARDSSSMIGK